MSHLTMEKKMKQVKENFGTNKEYDCVEIEQSDLSKNWSKNWDRYGFDDTCVICCKPCNHKAKTSYRVIGVCGHHNTWLHPKHDADEVASVDGGFMGVTYIGSDCYSKLPKEFKEYVIKKVAQ
jgi:hypothetical protein